jgi:hypothetical protein
MNTSLVFRRGLLAACLLLLFVQGNAQSERGWPDLMEDPAVRIQDVREAFDREWEGKEMVKGRGYKQFKRWEYFMEQRCYPTGDRFAPDVVLRAMQERPEMFLKNNLPGIWTYIGNTSIPGGGGGAGRVNSVRPLPGSTTTFFACAPAGGVWKTTDTGGSWTLLNTDQLASIGVSDIAIDPSNTNILYIATSDGDAGDTYSIGVLKSTNGGATWNSTGLNWQVTQTRVINRLLIHPTNTQVLIAATSDGIYRTTNGGTSWTQELAGSYKDLKFKPGSPATVYTTGNGDDFFYSSDTGDSWTQVTSGLPTSGVSRMSLAVSAANSNYVYLLAGNNTDYGLFGVYRSTNSGLTWTQQADASPNLLTWDENGTGTGGQAWYDLSLECDQEDANIIFVGGVNTWRSLDGGINWTCIGHWYGAAGIPYVHADIHSLTYLPGTNTLLVGSDGGVFRTTNNGGTFADISSNLQIGQQYRLGNSVTNANRVLTGWQDNGTNLKDGSSWNRVIGGDGFESIIDPTNANTMYGALYYGGIFKTTTGPGGFSQLVGYGGSGVNESGAWLTPYVLGTNPNHLYIGKSTVYRSTNGGASFTALGAFGSGSINALAVAPSNNNYIYASKGGQLWRSTDGTNFTSVGGMPGNYITYIAVHPTNPNTVWLTFSGYDNGVKVYQSTNGGTNWTNISGALPNIPANCITYQVGSNDGVYVGTDAGVYYRDNTIGTWTPYMNGLPNVVVSELEIHYATGTIRAATYGRGLWSAPLYTLPATDAALLEVLSPAGTLCATTLTPQFTLSNAGNNTLTSATIQYTVSGQSPLSFNWTGSLATGNATTVSLPSLDYGTGSFTITFTLTSVNGIVGDDNASNNALSATYVVTGGTNDVTLTLSTDCWGNETTWTLTDALGNAVYSGGPYTSLSTFTIPMCLPNGCFSLNVFDSYGDGMAGSLFGCATNGNYFITDDNSGYLLAGMTTANFGSAASHSFCVPFVVVAGCTDPQADNYNPAANLDDGSCTYSCVSHTLTVATDCWGEEVSWSLTDPGGVLVASAAINTLADQTTHTWNLCLDLGCSYTFSIQDSYGDGLNGTASGCAVNGNYFLTNNLGATVFQMAAPNYGFGTTHTFCVGTPGCTQPLACNYNAAANVDNGTCVFPVANDQCAQAIPLTINGGPLSADNTNTCYDGPNPNCANNGGTTVRDIWYSFVYNGGNITVSTALGSNTDTRLAVYTGCGGVILACDDDSGPGLASLINFTCPGSLIPGQTYLVQAGGWADVEGTFSIQVTMTNISGCTNPLASNYNACATVDNGSCLVPGCTDVTACNYNPGANQNNGTCTYPGCLDPLACNYNAAAGCAAACNYPVACNNPAACNYTAGSCMNGTCNFPVACNDPNACNYTAGSCMNGTCNFPVACNDPNACNYTAGSCMNGTCNFPVPCNDPNACNYTAGSCMNGTCNYPVACNDPNACNYTAGSCMNGTCNYPVACNDPNACNYTAGSCMNGTCSYPATWYQDADSDGYGNLLAPLGACAAPAGYVTNGLDCNDGNAQQYPGAPGMGLNIDNNCNGMLDPQEQAGCLGDFTEDGAINVSDLLLFMSAFGCSSACGPFDMNGDGYSNVNDLLVFISVFGTNC